jgi:hypothetical protein
MALAFALKDVTAVGPGQEFRPSPGGGIKAHVYTTGGPDIQVQLEGTLDGIFWHMTGNVFINSPDSSGFVSGTGVAPNGMPFQAVRANLVSLSGGTSPTVTVYAEID